MISDPEGTVLALFAAFCRIGGCFMVLPGFSSARISVQFRVFASLAISMAILPLLWDTLYASSKLNNATYVITIISEILIGVTIGLVARFITLALQFTGTALTMAIGFNAPPMGGMIENEPEGTITTLLSFAAILLLFIGDFHHLIIQTLVNSYDFMPLGTNFDPRMALVTLTDTLGETFMLALRLASPFLVYGLLFNLSLGIVNKLAPQMPLYFISMPFIIIGGMVLLFLGSSGFLTLFIDGFMQIFQGR